MERVSWILFLRIKFKNKSTFREGYKWNPHEKSLFARGLHMSLVKSLSEALTCGLSTRGLHVSIAESTFRDRSQTHRGKFLTGRVSPRAKLHFAISPPKITLFWRFFILSTKISYSNQYFQHFIINFYVQHLRYVYFFIFSLIIVVFLVLLDFFRFSNKLLF